MENKQHSDENHASAYCAHQHMLSISHGCVVLMLIIIITLESMHMPKFMEITLQQLGREREREREIERE